MLKRHDFAHEFRAKSLLVDVFFRSVDDLFELNYLLGLLNRQNIKHELFAFPCHCGSLLLQCIALSVDWLKLNTPLLLNPSPAITAGSTTYRFYVDMQDPTDRMSAVFGNDQASLLVNTPAGAFNSPFNSSWNASGINPAFLPVFPELADDSYATIGLTGPASTSGIAGAADPSLWRTPPNQSRLTS